MTQKLINDDIKVNDYIDLFIKYDTDQDDLLTKENLLKMMHNSGMKYATNAEATFVFNLIARFKPTMTVETFNAWAMSMRGLP